MEKIANKFRKMGARLRVSAFRNRTPRTPFAIDVRKDKKGEFFDLQINDVDLCEVVNVDPADRHLLLAIQAGSSKEKFLCGHDERHWFVAGVNRTATTVKAAKDALRPRVIKVKSKERFSRRNSAFVRQGEWFFVPAPDKQVPDNLILKNEPIRRGRSKPHVCAELYREGGQLVWVCYMHPNGLSQFQYEQLIKTNPDAKNWRWSSMVRDPEAYVRGKVKHPDHKTVVLSGWHKVMPNLEASSRNNAFLD